jgi:uncharacterized protein YegL
MDTGIAKHYIIALDVSWSMDSHIKDMVKGVNTFLERIWKEEKETENILSLIIFNNDNEYIFEGRKIRDITPVDGIKCGGCTALYDVIGKVFTDFGMLNQYKHYLYIITDGDDNASKKFRKETIDMMSQTNIDNGIWDIIHCHTDISKLNTSHNIIYNVDDLESLFANLNIVKSSMDDKLATSLGDLSLGDKMMD